MWSDENHTPNVVLNAGPPQETRSLVVNAPIWQGGPEPWQVSGDKTRQIMQAVKGAIPHGIGGCKRRPKTLRHGHELEACCIT
jgi:hypothetical protein